MRAHKEYGEAEKCSEKDHKAGKMARRVTMTRKDDTGETRSRRDERSGEDKRGRGDERARQERARWERKREVSTRRRQSVLTTSRDEPCMRGKHNVVHQDPDPVYLACSRRPAQAQGATRTGRVSRTAMGGARGCVGS